MVNLAVEYRVSCIVEAMLECEIAVKDLRNDLVRYEDAEKLLRDAYNDIHRAIWNIRQIPCFDLN